MTFIGLLVRVSTRCIRPRRCAHFDLSRRSGRVPGADSRGADRHLRVTWPRRHVTIVSVIGPGGYAGRRPPWHRLILSKVANLLVKALGEMASRPAAAKSPGAPG